LPVLQAFVLLAAPNSYFGSIREITQLIDANPFLRRLAHPIKMAEHQQQQDAISFHGVKLHTSFLT
jgi:hypothetical protein